MPDDIPFTKADLTAQISELHREKAMRFYVYPNLIARGKLKRPDAEEQQRQIEAAIKSIEWLAARAK